MSQHEELTRLIRSLMDRIKRDPSVGYAERSNLLLKLLSAERRLSQGKTLSESAKRSILRAVDRAEEILQ